MRQICAFIEAMQVRNATKEYYRNAFMASLHGAEMISLDEILGVSSEDSGFDKATDEAMEKRALQMLEERKWMYNV